jgi:hypothetical protein
VGVLRVTVGRAWVDGWRRVAGAPWIVVGVWLSTILIALPLAHLLGRQIAGHLGGSLAAAAVEDGVNFDWWNEFLAQAAGIGQTFVPAILGFAAILKNVSSIADATPVASAIAPFVVMSVLLTMFFTGGVLDRLARRRAIGASGFFAACGVFLFRFLRLGAIAGLVYWILFTSLHPLLLHRAYAALTHDVTVERTAFLYRLGLYAMFGVALLAANLTFDYARIRMVVEDRRSAIGSLGAAIRFVTRNPGAAVGLYLLNTGVFAALLAIYAMVAFTGAVTWTALLVGQLYIVSRVVVRMLFAASQIALFQSRLAHAGYTAAPVRVWPDSPAAEAIRPQ